MKVEDRLSKIQSVVEQLNNRLSKLDDELSTLGVALDQNYSGLIEDLKKEAPNQGKSKMSKKQRKEKALALIKEKHPDIHALLEVVDEFVESLTVLVDEKLEKLEDLQEKIEELEDLEDELEQKKSELGI